MNVQSIDPGTAGKGCAVAYSVHGRIIEVCFERFHERCWIHRPRALDRVVVERPEYQGARSDNARTGDLINLSWDGGTLAAAYAAVCDVELVELTPTQWKGQEAKPVQHARLWEILDASERLVLGGAPTYAAILRARERGALKRWKISGAACYPKSFTTQNLLDAAALNATYTGRLEKKG